MIHLRGRHLRRDVLDPFDAIARRSADLQRDVGRDGRDHVKILGFDPQHARGFGRP